MLAALAMAAVIALLGGPTQVAANIEQPKNLNDLYEAARALESVHMQITEHRKSYAERRYKALYAFVREPKSEHCDAYYGPALKAINEYRIKAYQYVADSKKQTGWFGNIMKIMGPSGSMKALSKPYPELAQVTERYESQSKSGILTNIDVDCDLLKFHIRVLNKMMFVLQTDIKYLATEDKEISNRAIYHQLLRNDFVSTNNFYSIQELRPDQAKLLREFYLARVDIGATKVERAVEQFSKPSNLIIGRLLESCYALVDHKNTWQQLEPERVEKCAQSKSDLKNNLFANELRLSDYESTLKFCEPFINLL
jgi:hypothetical protein